MADIKERIDHYEQLVKDHDVEGMLALLADGVGLLWLPVDTYQGHKEIQGAWEMLFTAFPDFNRTIDSVMISGNNASVEFTVTGTFTGGPFDGYQPTGQSGEILGAEFLSFDDSGMITSIHTYWDGMQMARELGLMPDEDSLLDRGMHGALNVMTRARRVIRL